MLNIRLFRHFAKVKETVLSELKIIKEKFNGDFRVSITGSAGLGLSQRLMLNIRL